MTAASSSSSFYFIHVISYIQSEQLTSRRHHVIIRFRVICAIVFTVTSLTEQYDAIVLLRERRHRNESRLLVYRNAAGSKQQVIK